MHSKQNIQEHEQIIYYWKCVDWKLNILKVQGRYCVFWVSNGESGVIAYLKDRMQWDAYARILQIINMNIELNIELNTHVGQMFDLKTIYC